MGSVDPAKLKTFVDGNTGRGGVKYLGDRADLAKLTPDERRVLAAFGQAKTSDKKMLAKLGLDSATVFYICASIQRKLGVTTLVSLRDVAKHLGVR